MSISIGLAVAVTIINIMHIRPIVMNNGVPGHGGQGGEPGARTGGRAIPYSP